VKEKPTVSSALFKAIPSKRIPNVTKKIIINFSYLFPAAIPVNYTKEIRKLFEATTY
jgi:hypothetical protein